MPLLEFGPGVPIYPRAAPLNLLLLAEVAREEGVPEEAAAAGVEPRPLKMEEEVEGPVETGRQVGAVEVGEELPRALCWGEEVVHPYLAGRVAVGVGRQWALWMEAVEAALLGLWKGVGEEGQCCGEVEEVAVLLWMVEVEVLVVEVHLLQPLRLLSSQ